MIELPYCLIIEATEEPDFFGFYSPDLGGIHGNRPFCGGLPVTRRNGACRSSCK